MISIDELVAEISDTHDPDDMRGARTALTLVASHITDLRLRRADGLLTAAGRGYVLERIRRVFFEVGGPIHGNLGVNADGQIGYAYDVEIAKWISGPADGEHEAYGEWDAVAWLRVDGHTGGGTLFYDVEPAITGLASLLPPKALEILEKATGHWR